MENLIQVGQDITRLRKSLNSARLTVLSTLDESAQNALTAELRLETAIKRLQGRIHEELSALPQDGVLQIEVSPVEEVEAFLERLRDTKDKRLPFFETVLDVARNRDLDIALDGDVWVLLRDGKELARTAGTGSRLDLLIPVDSEGPVTILPSCESLKAGNVVLQGKAKNLTIFRERVEAWIPGPDTK